MSSASSRRRWLPWALVASLGVNLVVAGIVAGAFLYGPPDRPPREGGWAIAHDLPEPFRGEMLREMRHESDKWIGKRRQLHGQREALAEALEAEPFRVERIESILADSRATLDELAGRSAAMLIDQVRRMDPDDRADYAKKLRGRHEHGPRRERRDR